MFAKSYAIEFMIPKLIGKFDYPPSPPNPRLNLSQKILDTSFNPQELTFLYDFLEDHISCAFISNNTLTFHYFNLIISTEVDWSKRDKILAALFVRENGIIQEKKGQYFRLWDGEENIITNGSCSCSTFAQEKYCIHIATVKVFNQMRREFKRVDYLVRKAIL